MHINTMMSNSYNNSVDEASSPLVLGCVLAMAVGTMLMGAGLLLVGLVSVLGFMRSTVGQALEGDTGREVIAALDGAHDFEDASETAPPAPKGPNLFRFAAVLAGDVKRKLGSVPKPTEANRLVAWDLLNKACEARDVRKVDRLRFMQVAVDMVFIGDALDVQMTRCRRSLVVQDRMADVGGALTWGEWVRSRLFGRSRGLRFHQG
nr:MAG: RNA-dependent RNA polymerase [Chemarfal virus 123]